MSVKTPNHEKMFVWIDLYQFGILNMLLNRFYGYFFTLAAMLEMCKLDSEDAIFQIANIGFWIQHTKIPQIGISNPFLHKMPVPS